jgi:hypothetical protein
VKYPVHRLFTLFLILALSATKAQIVPGRESTGRTSERILCASLLYGGKEAAPCFSDRFLARLNSETRMHAEIGFRPVRLNSPQLFQYPFAVMAGEGAFHLTEEEQKQLRRYLSSGGFVLASAGCSDPNWASSFQREVGYLFPGGRFASVPPEHLLFHILYRIDDMATVHSDNPHKQAQLKALTIHGRMVAIFSEAGLNDSQHSENCCCCGGDEIAKAEFLNANILVYALLH